MASQTPHPNTSRMNAAPQSAQNILQELHAWCQAARTLYESSGQRHDSPGLRALKLYLAERHTEHLRELRHCLYHIGALGPTAGRSYQGPTLPGLGNEIHRALISAHRPTVILACSSVEKQIALGYERALADPALTDAETREIVSRHAVELESSQSFVRQIQVESSRPFHAPTNGLHAGASTESHSTAFQPSR